MIHIRSALEIVTGNFSVHLYPESSGKFCIMGSEKCHYQLLILDSDFPNLNGRSAVEHIAYILQLCFIASEGALCNDCEYKQKYNPNSLSIKELSLLANEENVEKITEVLKERGMVYTSHLFN